MKKKILLFIGMMAVASSLIFDGCKKKDDDEVDARDKFIGSYSVINGCIGPNTYNCIITKSTQSGKVVVSNMGNEGWTATGTISGNNITLSGTQSDAQCGSVTIGGSGTINGIVLTLSNVTYTFTQCSNLGPCAETFTKQ